MCLCGDVLLIQIKMLYVKIGTTDSFILQKPEINPTTTGITLNYPSNKMAATANIINLFQQTKIDIFAGPVAKFKACVYYIHKHNWVGYFGIRN